MSLEIGSHFRLPDGRLVEVVPDTERILGMKVSNICVRCPARFNSASDCLVIGCLARFNSARDCLVIGCLGPYTKDLEVGFPRILKEVENEP